MLGNMVLQGQHEVMPVSKVNNLVSSLLQQLPTHLSIVGVETERKVMFDGDFWYVTYLDKEKRRVLGYFHKDLHTLVTKFKTHLTKAGYYNEVCS